MTFAENENSDNMQAEADYIATPRRPLIKRSDLIVGILLVLVLVAGLYLRFVGQNWDDYTHLHPDERFLAGVASSLNGALDPSGGPEKAGPQLEECRKRYPETGGAAPSIFDSLCSTWYPKNASSGTGLYVYGELPLFIVRISAELTRQIHEPQAAQTPDKTDDMVARNWTEYNGIHLVGRTVSAIGEWLSLIFLFLIGRRLYNKWVGLLAAALGAAAVLPIQLSHYWTTDAFTNLPVLITFWFAIRAMDRGRWYDFVGSGIALGMAMASRINTLPLGGVIVLGAMIYALPALDLSLITVERRRLIRRAVIGCVLAGVFTLLSFRITMPHAFTGGPGVLGFFNIVPYGPWIDDLKQAAALSSGAVDFPPDHQWASRTPYLFPLRNIVLWGLGLPLGLAAVVGWLWAAVQTLRSRPQWTRHILPVVWMLVYFGYMGRQWVMTMRYFMPLYPFFILMAAWALYELATRAYRWQRANPLPARRLLYGVGVALMVLVVGGTFLWGYMFTSIYRRQLTRVEASRWVFRNLSSPVSATLTLSDGRERLINFRTDGSIRVNIIRYEFPDPKLASFIPTARSEVDRVLVNGLIDPSGVGGKKKFSIAISDGPDGANIIAQGNVEIDFSNNADAGKPLTVILDKPLALDPNVTYFLLSWTGDKLAIARAEVTDAADFVLSNANSDSLGRARLPVDDASASDPVSAVFADQPAQGMFQAPYNGSISQINITHLLNVLGNGVKSDFTVKVLTADRATTLAEQSMSVTTGNKTNLAYGDPVNVKLDKPIDVKKDDRYIVELSSAAGSPLQVTGTIIANEGAWDDPIPWSVCDLPIEMDLTHDSPSGVNPVTCEGLNGLGLGWYKGPELDMSAEDDDSKRVKIQEGLDQSDYFIISSNRFYDTVTRLPLRYPVSIAFYKKLFSGELGYKLDKTIASFPAIGGFEIADQYLPTFSAPNWLNEWESEEAFSVYDHPTVFIFKREPNYNPNTLRDVLYGVPNAAANDINVGAPEDQTLINRITWNAKIASQAPTGFMLTEDQRSIQAQGGTFSEMFNREWLINQNPLVAVIGWWLAILLFGFAAWPLLFTILPGLPDRGYPFAKLAGMLIVAWIVWAGGTLRLLTWSQGGILLTLIGLGLFGLWLAWRKRTELIDFMRLNWRHLVIIELVTLVLFLIFVFVRLGNPDLWAQTLGGEKPMDFAYFNAVLRSTIFPPYDPWYSGGYLNYYYFGFVLVGTPVKLLGVLPAIAYNLVLPTLFATTGIGAFSLAFNLVASRWFTPNNESDEGDENGETLKARRRFALRVPAGSPYLAGAMALLLCVVLGNLDTPRVVLTGLARAGSYSSEVIADGRFQIKLADFVQQNGRPPNPDEEIELHDAVAHPSFGDQLKYGVEDLQQYLGSLGRGVNVALGGGVLPISPDRWFWGPRSVVGELPNSSNEINEFPYFTFVYADLHAHMMAFPLTLMALAWLFSEVLAAGNIQRPTWVAIGATVFGGLIIGTLLATNTWDWITYLILSILTLIFTAFLRRKQLGRRALLGWLAQIGGFFVVQWFVALPFTLFWSTSYNAVASFEGEKTPIWAYFDMHGVFLFIIISLLIWQTVQVLRNIYVRDLIGKIRTLTLLTAVILGALVLSLLLAIVPFKISLLDLPIPLALLLIPLLAWCAILFMLPDQSRQNRILYAMIGLALGVTLGVEIIVLGSDIGRQNTFFKFYLQAWMLFSVVSGVAVAWLFHASHNWRPVLRATWLGILALLFAIAGLFPIMSTQGKVAMRMAPEAPHTLDGDAYMDYATYYEGSFPIPLKDDYAMIRWLQDNVQGTPVILEGSMTEYKLGARISINTGLPTIAGWNFHQRQQRTIDPLPNTVFERIANIAAMYNTTNIAIAWRMMKFYQVEYIISGKLEHVVYQPEGLTKFDEMVKQGLLDMVYDENGDRIYHIKPGASPSLLQAGGR